MLIHHLRNATLVIESNNNYILVDPMLGVKGSLPPFAYFRFKKQNNPLVELPKKSSEILAKVTHILITHSHTFGLKALQHTDHLDTTGENFIKERNLPVCCGHHDQKYLTKQGFHVTSYVKHWETKEFLGGKITAIPAKHGHSWNHKMMANGSGFVIELPNEPSLYISGDTVLTDDVKKALIDFKPEVTVVACGTAQVDLGPPILMTSLEIEEFVKLSPGKVICNHLEALNHCPTTRKTVRELLDMKNPKEKYFIPNDGETLTF